MKATSTWPRLLCVLGVLAVVVTPSAAFVPFEGEPRWPRPPGECTRAVVGYRINPNFPDLELSGTREQQVEILRCGAGAWESQSQANFTFNFLGTTSRSGFNLGDNVNVLSWVSDDGDAALAATVLNGLGNRLTDFDTVFFASTNGTENRWSGPQDTVSGTTDIAGVTTHELGHALGLDHTPVSNATMFATARNRGLTLRTLHADDIAGVEFLYCPGEARSTSPTLTLVEPDFGSAAGGNEVVLKGTNFTWTGDTSLFIGGQRVSRARYDVESCETLRIHDMPPGDRGPADVSVSNELGTVELENGYNYGDAPPELLAIEPDTGPIFGGIAVTVRGAQLTEAAVVTIGGAALEQQELVDANTITGILPGAAQGGPVDVRLVQGANESTLEDGFEYNAMVLRLVDTEAAPGEDVPIDVTATNDEALKGFSFGISYDPSLLTIDAVSTRETGTAEAEFAAANVNNETGVTTFGLVMRFAALEPNIPVGMEEVVTRILGTVNDDAVPGTEIPVAFEDGAGKPPIDLLVNTLDNTTIRPFALDGTVTVVPGAVFLRGDSNDDGKVGISDAVFTLTHLFQAGDPPVCQKAADANDDGSADISDAVYTLIFLFNGGDVIPPPFPDPGPDPTPDDLSC